MSQISKQTKESSNATDLFWPAPRSQAACVGAPSPRRHPAAGTARGPAAVRLRRGRRGAASSRLNAADPFSAEPGARPPGAQGIWPPPGAQEQREAPEQPGRWARAAAVRPRGAAGVRPGRRLAARSASSARRSGGAERRCSVAPRPRRAGKRTRRSRIPALSARCQREGPGRRELRPSRPVCFGSLRQEHGPLQSQRRGRALPAARVRVAARLPGNEGAAGPDPAPLIGRAATGRERRRGVRQWGGRGAEAEAPPPSVRRCRGRRHAGCRRARLGAVGADRGLRVAAAGRRAEAALRGHGAADAVAAAKDHRARAVGMGRWGPGCGLAGGGRQRGAPGAVGAEPRAWLAGSGLPLNRPCPSAAVCPRSSPPPRPSGPCRGLGAGSGFFLLSAEAVAECRS